MLSLRNQTTFWARAALYVSVQQRSFRRVSLGFRGAAGVLVSPGRSLTARLLGLRSQMECIALLMRLYSTSGLVFLSINCYFWQVTIGALTAALAHGESCSLSRDYSVGFDKGCRFQRKVRAGATSAQAGPCQYNLEGSE